MSEELQDQEVVETDDLDIDSEIESFESEWNDSEDETTEENTSTEENPEGEEPQQEEETPEEQGDNEEQENVNSDDEQKRNRAFADLRRQAQENEKYAKFVNQLAEQSGVKPEEVLQRFEERRLQQQAEQQNVPVDVIKRINDLESYKQQTEYKQYEQNFNQSVENTIDKYDIPENELQETFKQMAQNGIDFRQPGFDFESQYLRFNKDNVVKREIERTRQQELEEKKKRQSSSAIPSGNSTSPTDEVTDDYVDKMLKEFDISID